MLKVERKRFECNALPKGWTREEVIRRSGLMSGKVDVFYYRFVLVFVACSSEAD